MMYLGNLVLISQIWAGLKTYGGASWDNLWNLDIQANRIVMTLFTQSYQIPASGSGMDFAIIITSLGGLPIWEKVYGQPNLNDWVYNVSFLNDGNAVAIGVTCVPSGGSPSSCDLPGDAFLIKVDASTGNVIWAKKVVDDYGLDDGWIRFFDVYPTVDGGFVVAGEILWCGFFTCDYDAVIAKFDALGNKQWYKIYGTGGNEWINSVFQTADNNIVAVMPSFDFIWIAKLNSTNGSIIWQRRYDRSIFGLSKYFTWAYPTSDGGFILADEISGSDKDILFVKFDANGNLICSRQISTSLEDAGISIVEGIGGYYLTGLLNAGNLFIAKIDKNTCNILSVRQVLSTGDEQGRDIDVNPSTDVPYVAGYTNNSSWSTGNYDGLLAADSLTNPPQDTCYWRNATYTSSIPTLTPSTLTMSDFTGTNDILVQNATYSFQDITTFSQVACGILTPLNTDESYADCKMDFKLQGKELLLNVKEHMDVRIEIYSVSGKKIYERRIEQAYGRYRIELPISKGMYIININGIRKRLVIY